MVYRGFVGGWMVFCHWFVSGSCRVHWGFIGICLVDSLVFISGLSVVHCGSSNGFVGVGVIGFFWVCHGFIINLLGFVRGLSEVCQGFVRAFSNCSRGEKMAMAHPGMDTMYARTGLILFWKVFCSPCDSSWFP